MNFGLKFVPCMLLAFLACDEATAACVPQRINATTSIGCNVSPNPPPVKIGPITKNVPTQKEIDLYNSPANAKNWPVIYPANSNVTLGIREVPANGIPSGSNAKRSPEAISGRAAYCRSNPNKCGE